MGFGWNLGEGGAGGVPDLESLHSLLSTRSGQRMPASVGDAFACGVPASGLSNMASRA